jgi:hypothetical protein
VAVGAFPGSFDPPTRAHLAIAEAAWRQGGLERLDLVVSRRPLEKAGRLPLLEHRLEVLERLAASRPWLGVAVSEAQLVADLVEGYDLVVMGADKWAQVNDPAWYPKGAPERDAALARLPRALVVPRPPHRPGRAQVLELAGLEGVSSTRARQGRRELMAPEAAAFDAATGAWTDPGRYLAWLEGRPA